MLHPQLVILGYSEAAMFMRGTSNPKVDAIISIHGARQFGVEADVAHRLDLEFDDVEVAAANDVMALQRASIRKRWCAQNGLAEIAPNPADVQAIIDFARQINGIADVLLCHCGAGISRAPAAAIICLATWLEPGREAECVATVLKLRPAAVPHVGLIRFADEKLGRGGKLVDALAQARR